MSVMNPRRLMQPPRDSAPRQGLPYWLRPVNSNGARQAAACPALVASLTSTRRPFFTS